jgi:hypothetical protein
MAQISGAPIAAGILYMDGVGGLRGWQWLFILEGSITAVYGIMLRVRPSMPVVFPSPHSTSVLHVLACTFGDTYGLSILGLFHLPAFVRASEA